MIEKHTKSIVDKFQDGKPDKENIYIIEKSVDKSMDNKEDDFFVEIIRMNSDEGEQMTEDQYNVIFEQLESIRPTLSEEQRKKLDKIIDVLKAEK